MRTYEKALLAINLSLLACAGNGAIEQVRPPDRVARPVATAPPGTARLSAAAIARVPAGTFGPYLGMSARGGVSVWASMDSGARSWFARAYSAKGDALGQGVRLGEAPSELGLVTIRPFHEGFALLTTHKVSDGEVVEVWILSASGAKIAGPIGIGHTAGALLWIEAIPNARGASILWAASGTGRAEIWNTEITAAGELVGAPRVLAHDAGAWQAVAFGKGFALGVVHARQGERRARANRRDVAEWPGRGAHSSRQR